MLPNDSPYNHDMCELTYMSDDGYVRGGKTGRIGKGQGSDNFESSWRLRYFP
ncbi:hypothetical protein, partial [Vibrio alginolyticus]|uniref:hypothetical protein n=1 Tax=Vibrio alginolyticus TaxID=663 RepID=UPI0034D95E77